MPKLSLSDPKYNTKVGTSSEYVPDAQVLDNQARAAKLGVSIPGLKPGITSSSDPMHQKNMETATNQAASALLTSGSNPYLDMIGQWREEDKKANDAAMKSVRLSLNADLAANDAKYAELHNDLQNNMNQSLEIAAANAAALNPYSQAQGAQTADNFNAAIRSKYADQARKLERQADLASQEIRAGNYEAYVKIMQDAQKSSRDFQQKVYDWMQQENDNAMESAKFEYQQGQDSIDNFVKLLKTNLPSLQALEAMDEKQLLALPAVQAGIAAGYDVNAAIQGVYDAASMQSYELEGAKLDNESKRASIANSYSQIRDRESKSKDDGEDMFTRTQLNSGAAAAGLDMGSFEALPDNIKNYYISNSGNKAFFTDLTAVLDGEMEAEELKEKIDASNNPPDVKAHLKERIDDAVPANLLEEQANVFERIGNGLGAFMANFKD